ncbi:MAG: MFS transporter [Treponema sp.]|jgi:MFS family permease|nr:MFS transporter [Treponema sp.]
MKQKEKNITAAVIMISIALTMRQMSMSIVAPFLSTYCRTLAGYTPLAAGLTLGIFGLMQAIFQTPFGMLSDRFGNKRIMLSGLAVTIIGLILAWKAQTIYLLIAARALQGSGAIIGVGYAWTAGIAPESKRTKAMGILSLMVSSGAAAAFILGPILRKFMKVNQIFLICAVVIILTGLYILLFIPDTGKKKEIKQVSTAAFGKLIKNRKFMSLSVSAFLNNFMMMSIFFALPVYLTSLLNETELWIVFIPAILFAFLTMRIAVRVTDQGNGSKVLFLSFIISTLSILLFFDKNNLSILVFGTTIFFGSYAALAAVIASEVNMSVADEYRGTANGMFNALQYLGNFAGAVVTGFLWKFSDKEAMLPVIGTGIAGIAITVLMRQKREKPNKKEQYKHER